MKHTLYIIAAAALLLAGCSKADDNGDLGGNWQLTPEVYFSVYTDMAQWRDVTKGEKYMSHFQQRGDSIILTLTDGTPGMYLNDGSNDTSVTDAALMPANIPVPQGFAYKVKSLTTSELILSAEGNEYVLRKY